MDPIRIGLVADPAAPTEVARGLTDLGPLHGDDTWDICVVSEPFTTGSEDVEVAVGRLEDHARKRNWELVIGLTELPLHDHEGRHLVAWSIRSDGPRCCRCLRWAACACTPGPVGRCARWSAPSQTRTGKMSNASPCLQSGVAGACSWAWCWPTARGCWYPG
jgi:hypothetical protein